MWREIFDERAMLIIMTVAHIASIVAIYYLFKWMIFRRLPERFQLAKTGIMVRWLAIGGIIAVMPNFGPYELAMRDFSARSLLYFSIDYAIRSFPVLMFALYKDNIRLLKLDEEYRAAFDAAKAREIEKG